MAKKKSDKNININIGGDAKGTTIIVGDSNAVGQGSQKSDDIKSRFLVPFPHNPDFVGRDEELSSLHEMLQQKQSIVGIRPTVLVGLGGIGKTQLAVEYAHAYRADYPSGVFWLNAINPLLIEFSDLAEKLEMSDRDTPRDKAARKAWDYLDSHPDALVIFDNVLEPSELNLPFSPDLVPANLRCRTLFTTRQRDFPRTFQPFEVKVLPEMAAMKLLLRSRPEVLEKHHPEWGWARIVCAYLGWLPLALELAAAYLGAYPEVSITGYLERLRTEGSLETVDASEVRAVDLPTRVEEILKAAAEGNLEITHQVAVSATLQTQWKRLDDDSARLLFRAAGQFPEASWIPIPRLGLLTGIESEAYVGRPSPLNVALKKLYAISLIEELTEDRLRLHPLVHEFAAHRSSASFRLEMAKRVAAEMNDLLRLQARVICHGVDMMLGDLRTALAFCIDLQKTETYTRISCMERVLDRLAHGLRSWNAQEQPVFFSQQIRQMRNESFFQSLKQWQEQAEVQLTRLGKPYLLERFPVRSEPAELRTLAGHSDSVTQVALSLDGRVAVSASADKTLKIWDVETGRELRTLAGHNDAVTGVALSSDGRLAVSSSADKTLKTWDIPSGRELHTFTGHDDPVRHVALSADGRVIASASTGKTFKVWDVSTGLELHTLAGHDGDVTAVALSGDGLLTISASEFVLKVWDTRTGRELHSLPGHNRWIESIVLSADGRLVATAESAITDFDVYERGSSLVVCDMKTGQQLYNPTWDSDHVASVALSMDGRLAVSAGDRTLKIWNVETGRILRTLSAHSGTVNSVAISADGRLAVSASTDKTLKVWDISAACSGSDQERSLETNKGVWYTDKHGVSLSSDARLAISTSGDTVFRVWQAPIGRESRKISSHGSLISVALSGDGAVAASIAYTFADGEPHRQDEEKEFGYHTVKVWDVAMGRTLQTLKGHGDATSIALSADGRLAVSASDDKDIRVWDISTGSELRRLIGHSSNVKGVALSADGRLAVSASDDKTLKVWDVSTGRELHTFTGHDDPVRHVALSADGRLAISLSWDQTVKVWDIPAGRELRTLIRGSNRIYQVALSPDGRLAISVSTDMTLKVWDIASGNNIATLLTGISLSCCAMSAGTVRRTIVAGDVGGGVHFLELIGVDEE